MFIFSLYHTAFILSTRIISVMMPKPVNYKSASSASKELPDIFIYLATYLLRPISYPHEWHTSARAHRTRITVSIKMNV